MMEREKSIMEGKGEWEESEHPRDKDGKFINKGSPSQRKRLTKSNQRDIIHLSIVEYAKFCHAIRTLYANHIPQKGSLFLENNYYIFAYNKKEERITCKDRIQIVGNEEIINSMERVYGTRTRK